MILDLKLTQIGLKMKNLIVLDLSFPNPSFPEFKSKYEERYIHLPARQGLAPDFACGLAMLGKVVLLYGLEGDAPDIEDPTLNVKIVKRSSEAVWDYFEEELMEFGPEVLLIPELLILEKV